MHTTHDLLIGTVPSSLVGVVIDYCQHQCLPLPKHTALYQRQERLYLQEWRDLLAELAQHDPQPALGLAIASYARPKHVGVLAYLSLACSTLGEALQQFQRYYRLAYDGSVPTLAASDTRTLTVSWAFEAGRPGQLVDEFAIGLFYQLIKHMVSPQAVPLQHVSFINPTPRYRAPYERFFGCPVSFEDSLTRVSFDMSLLALPLAQPDQALQRILDAQAQALLAALPSKDIFDQEFQQAVVQAIQYGEVKLAEIAERLNLSVRALQRRLSNRGTHYQTELDRIRLTLANQYLQDPCLGLADIALLLGYSEQSAFQRAYRQWTGLTPQKMRLQFELKA
ncbi:MAG: AraC family transcriptional regulator ligand-binding domain-containing protein [Pseudomonadota bacterium]|nr:AraC family transcriptional regulator ligand-binding domain-containing protein [Pseudomonadota bacterium]